MYNKHLQRQMGKVALLLALATTIAYIIMITNTNSYGVNYKALLSKKATECKLIFCIIFLDSLTKRKEHKCLKRERERETDNRKEHTLQLFC